jgi:hypothetical protein
MEQVITGYDILGNLMRDLDTIDHVRPVWVRSGQVISG